MPSATGSDDALTVSQLTQQIDRALAAGLPNRVLVKGELSNYKAHAASGHSYFTLKDQGSCINCVMWRSEAAKLKFRPEDGMEVLAAGRVSVYAQQGKYQLYATTLSPLGQGALELALQQMVARLEREGLFAKERKRPLPPYPMRLAIVTSTQTAALRDMLKVLARFPWIKRYVYHVPVQGDGSAERIAAAIEHVNATAAGQLGGIDLIILGRGGGSLEDLWEFNEEVVARAICASRIPIITGIGHEIDTSIADLCADYFAHTPTEAAQVATQHWRTAAQAVDGLGSRLHRAARLIVQDGTQRVAAIERHEFFRRPLERLNRLRQVLDDRERALSLAVGQRLRGTQRRLGSLHARLEARRPQHLIRLHGQTLSAQEARLGRAVAAQISRWAALVQSLESQLNALNPHRVLQRGYTITRLKKTQAVVRGADQLKPGDRIVTHFADGQRESVVEDERQLPLFE